MANTFEQQVAHRERFEFGKNWQRFLRVLDDDRLLHAERSLQELLDIVDLRGRSFVDVGSGSGLFSLAAVRLGAKRVHSLDFDPCSVRCTSELRRRYFPQAGNWTVEEASALDRNHLQTLGQFDVVYSWGVLHHTGDLWRALDNLTLLVGPGGQLALAIYNDQGERSQKWLQVKHLYSRGGLVRASVIVRYVGGSILRNVSADLRHARSPLERYQNYATSRGMSWWYDMLDWLGGLPFEVATIDRVSQFCAARGFVLARLVPSCGFGNNQFVFLRNEVRL
jgi:2-polyprenyl-3-methyl-5-hydroxy-6-metoxy-1,4-benzoquinol methylase